MPNYQESTLSGTEYTRCAEVQIINPYQQPPTVRFIEERALILSNGRAVLERVGDLSLPFDPARRIPLRHPVTLEPTGEISSYGLAYQIILSAYIDAALARDAASAPAPDSETPA